MSPESSGRNSYLLAKEVGLSLPLWGQNLTGWAFGATRFEEGASATSCSLTQFNSTSKGNASPHRNSLKEKTKQKQTMDFKGN